MRFELTVALRFLREGRFQSLLIIVGVAAGVAVVTYISALVEGLQGNTIAKTLGNQAHVVVKPREEVARPTREVTDAVLARDVQARAQRLRSIDNWAALIPLLERTPNVVAASPMATGAALALRGDASKSIALVGIELDKYDRIVDLSSKVVQGEARIVPGEALIGTELARDFGIGVGDRFTVQTAAGGSDVLKVAGLLDLGNRELNRRQVYISLRAAQSLLNVPGGVTNIDIKVAQLFEAETTAALIRRQTDMEIESWMQTNAQLLSALNAQTISTLMIRVFTSIVVVLGIASVLVVSVVQKRKEIGILRAMGATRRQMTQVFLTQGAIVGLLGSILGTILAAFLLWGFSTFVRGSDGQPLFVISLSFNLAFGVALGATVCGILAAVLPALRAARLDPAQAIRI